MTRTNKTTLLGFFVFTFIGIVLCSAACAREPGSAYNYPAGASIGTSLGLNPPTGFYVSNIFNYYGASVSAANSQLAAPSVNLTSASDIPKLIWSTPYTILGATEMVYIAEPIVDLTVTKSTGTNRQTGLANPAIAPINLSWSLGDGFHVAGIFVFYPPTGQYDVTHKANIGNNFWTVQPEFAASYLKDGFDITLHAFSNINTENPTTHYTSGDQVFFDFTAAKWWGKVEAGAVAYYNNQVTNDVDNGTTFPNKNLTRPQQFALGGIVGYDFGPVKLQGWLTQDVSARDGGNSGTRFWTRLVAAF